MSEIRIFRNNTCHNFLNFKRYKFCRREDVKCDILWNRRVTKYVLYLYIYIIHNAVTFCIITVRQGPSWPQANIFYNISIVIYFIVLLSWRYKILKLTLVFSINYSNHRFKNRIRALKRGKSKLLLSNFLFLPYQCQFTTINVNFTRYCHNYIYIYVYNNVMYTYICYVYISTIYITT